MWLHQLGEADRACGGKAVGLARLIAAGLPVPEGFVIDHRAFDLVAEGRELPIELEREVTERVRRFALIAVRSSANIEDTASGAAAGVFSSRRAVDPADVWPAIRAVWTSARSTLATSYARARGDSVALGVIVQRYVEGERLTIYTRPPGAPNAAQVWIQRGGTLAMVSRSSDDPVVRLGLAAETAIAAARGADIELIDDGTVHWVVQARPIVHPVVAPRIAPPAVVLAPLEADGRVWTWDVAHNPDPLSTAQAELVECVDRANIAPHSLKVCGGYLYSARRPDPAARQQLGSGDLGARVEDIEARLSTTLGTPASLPASLDDAIDRFIRFYEIWATELSPLIAAERAHVTKLEPGARPSSIESTLLAAANGELDEAQVFERVGVMSPAWDVAVPTYGERPELVRDAIERARMIDRGRIDRASTSARQPEPALDLAERDDLWFARAQSLVRRALLDLGTRLGLYEDDVFWVPFDQLSGRIAPPIDPDGAHRIAGAARASARRAAQWAMPITVGEPARPATQALRGVGSGPRVIGRVRRFASLAGAVAPGRGEIVVTRSVTPALAMLVVGCAGLVSETGGPLDHGAALARELGIAHVVGCTDAWTVLADGMLVSIDADAGIVEVIAST